MLRKHCEIMLSVFTKSLDKNEQKAHFINNYSYHHNNNKGAVGGNSNIFSKVTK